MQLYFQNAFLLMNFAKRNNFCKEGGGQLWHTWDALGAPRQLPTIRFSILVTSQSSILRFAAIQNPNSTSPNLGLNWTTLVSELGPELNKAGVHPKWQSPGGA